MRNHLLHIVRPCGGPDCNVEGVEAVGEEVARVRTLDEVGGAAAGWTIEEGAVEIDDDQYTARNGKCDRWEERLREILG